MYVYVFVDAIRLAWLKPLFMWILRRRVFRGFTAFSIHDGRSTSEADCQTAAKVHFLVQGEEGIPASLVSAETSKPDVVD